MKNIGDLARGPGAERYHHIKDDPDNFELDDAPLLGTPEEIIERLKRLEAGGVENVLFAAPGASIAGLRTFAEEIMPAFDRSPMAIGAGVVGTIPWTREFFSPDARRERTGRQFPCILKWLRGGAVKFPCAEQRIRVRRTGNVPARTGGHSGTNREPQETRRNHASRRLRTDHGTSVQQNCGDF